MKLKFKTKVIIFILIQIILINVIIPFKTIYAKDIDISSLVDNVLKDYKEKLKIYDINIYDNRIKVTLDNMEDYIFEFKNTSDNYSIKYLYNNDDYGVVLLEYLYAIIYSQDIPFEYATCYILATTITNDIFAKNNIKLDEISSNIGLIDKKIDINDSKYLDTYKLEIDKDQKLADISFEIKDIKEVAKNIYDAITDKDKIFANYPIEQSDDFEIQKDNDDTNLENLSRYINTNNHYEVLIIILVVLFVSCSLYIFIIIRNLRKIKKNKLSKYSYK